MIISINLLMSLADWKINTWKRTDLFRNYDNSNAFFFFLISTRNATQNRDNNVSRRESFTVQDRTILSPSFRATIFRLRDERRILRRVTAIAASRLHACTDSCALADPKRATQADVEATGGLSRAVMDVGRLKFCEIPGSPCSRRYFQPVPHSLPFILSYRQAKTCDTGELSGIVRCLI